MTTNNQHLKFYFNHPEVWDLIRKDAIAKEINFLNTLYQEKKDIQLVLDVGSGSGIHAKALNDLGYDVTGIDINQTMIAYSKAKYPEISFNLGDMRNLSFKKTFDSLICLCTVFSYNTSNSEIDYVLQSFNQNLRKDGILVLDNINPIDLIESRSFKPVIEESEPYSNFGLTSTSLHTIDNVNQILREHRVISEVEGGKIVQEDTTHFRLFFPQELTYFLEKNGFKNVRHYTNFDSSKVGLHGWRLVTVAYKA